MDRPRFPWGGVDEFGAAKEWIWSGLFLATIFFAGIELIELYPARPDWWTWWDQGQYLEAAKAFYIGDWSSAHHWYPPGYSLLAAPFVPVFPKDPFVVIDLLCLIGSLLAVARLAMIMELPAALGILGFLLTTVINITVIRHFVLPWTSTPTGTLILCGLCLCLLPPKPKHSLLLGLIEGAILLIKPVDAVALVPVGLYYLVQVLRPERAGFSWQRLWRNAVPALLTFGCLGLTAALLHWRIYGWHLSAYEAGTTDGPVFLANQLGARLYALFVDPEILYGTFRHPVGLFVKFPWLVLGLCGMLIASSQRLSLAMLSASVMGYVLLYASYYDLTPLNLWHYNTVHYFVWTLPIFGVFAFYLMMQIFVMRSFAAGGIVLVFGILLLTFHPYLYPMGEAEAHMAGQQLTLDLSACTAPCAVDLDISGRIDEEMVEQIRFDPETVRKIGTRTWSIFPHDQGLRLLLSDTTDLGLSELTFPGESQMQIGKANLSVMKWKFL